MKIVFSEEEIKGIIKSYVSYRFDFNEDMIEIEGLHVYECKAIIEDKEEEGE